jgi:hypothetical protein
VNPSGFFFSLTKLFVEGDITPSTAVLTWAELESKFLNLQVGGRYRPRNCTSHHRVAIIVPFRNLTRGCRRFPCLALFAGVWFYFSLLLAVFSFVFVYVLLADDHVNNVSYFPFMSIKKLVPYFLLSLESPQMIMQLKKF